MSTKVASPHGGRGLKPGDSNKYVVASVASPHGGARIETIFSALFSLFLSGDGRHSKEMEYFQTRELTIESDQEIPVEADGELIPTSMPIVFKKAEKKLTVLV